MEYSDFTAALIHHLTNKTKAGDIAAIKEKAQEGMLVLPGADADPVDTSKDPAILHNSKEMKKAHKNLHAMALEHMLTLKLGGKKGKDLKIELDILPYVLSDKLFQAHGIESEAMDQATERMGLEADPEY